LTDRWILSRLARTIGNVTQQLNEFKYSEPLSELYRFFWNDFCDWYLEWIKPRMQNEDRAVAQNVLAFALDQVLRLLHPFVPFVTEGVFQKLNGIAPVRKLNGLTESRDAQALVVAAWPEELDFFADEQAEQDVSVIQSIIRAIRDIRSKYNKPPGEMLSVSAKSHGNHLDVLTRNADLICQLAQVGEFKAAATTTKPARAAVAIAETAEIYVDNVIDPEAERMRLMKQKEQAEKAKKAVEAKLKNKNFITKAKPEVVAQAREKLTELTEQLQTVEKHLFELSS